MPTGCAATIGHNATPVTLALLLPVAKPNASNTPLTACPDGMASYEALSYE